MSGRKTISNSLNVNTIEDGENAIYADLDNEMDGIITNSSGVTTSEQSVSTNVWIASGSTKQTIKSSGGIEVKIGNVTIGSSYTSGTSTATDWCKCTITGLGTTNCNVVVTIKNGTSVATPVDVTIQVTCTIDNADVTQNLTLTISPVRAGANGQTPTIYSLQPNPSEVNAGRNSSNLIDPRYHTIKCGYSTRGASNTAVDDATGNIDNLYRVFFKRRNRSTQAWDTSYKFYGYSVYYKQLVITSDADSGFDARTYDKVEFIIYENTSATTITSEQYDATKVKDRETVSAFADGATGDKGENSAIAFADPASISVPCTSGGSVTAQLDTTITFSMKVGTNNATVSAVSSVSGRIPSGCSIVSGSATTQALRITTSATASGMSGGATFKVTGSYDGKTYEAYVTVALIGGKQGIQGVKGDMSRNIYLAGEADELEGETFDATDYSAPYVHVSDDDSGQPICYVYIGTNGTNIEFPDADEYGTLAAPDWEMMVSTFNYLMTKAIFAAFAQLGSAIFNKDYMFSQWGYVEGLLGDKEDILDSTQYKYADPNNMFGGSDTYLRSKALYNNATTYTLSSLPYVAISSAMTLQAGRWYSLEIQANNGVAGQFMKFMVATSNTESAAINDSKGTLYAVNGDSTRVTVTKIFQCTTAGTYYLYACLGGNYSAFSVKLRIVTPCAFVPYLCMDLKSGKIAANNIIARGKLYANSSYYEHATKATSNGAIIVENESFVTLRGGGNTSGGGGSGTTITLPTPANSEGRVIEIFNGFTELDRGYFYLGYSGAISSNYFMCPTTSNGDLHYRAANNQQWSESYVKLWSDGTYWWVLKAEITQYVNGDLVIRPAQNI